MSLAARWIRLERDRIAAFAGFAGVQSARAAPAVLWARTGEGNIACALVVPLKYAPGRNRRWTAWALTPLVAAYRLSGLRAYLDADAVRLSGGTIATCETQAIGECAVALCCFQPVEHDFMDTLRGRIEAQQGWQFDHSWPSEEERAAIDDALAADPA
jgi:hypothetical protein